MNKLIAFLLVFLALSAVLAFSVHSVRASGDLWIERAPMPKAESNFGAVSVNGEIYAIGYNFTYVFDSSADTWVSKTSIPSHRQGVAIATCQNKIYVIGGWNSTLATDTWAIKSPLPMPTANLQANVVNSKIYVISGMSDIAKPTLSSSNWVYDPSSDSWSSVAPIPTPVFNYASTVVDDKIYIEGGGLSSSPYYSNLNQIYDPRTNSWTLGEPLPAALLSASAGATTGVLAPAKLYIIGGTHNGYDGITTTQIYDPQTGKWTLGAAMPNAREALAVAVVNDSLYALGGVSGSGPGMNRGTVYALNEQYIPLDYQGSIPSPYIPTPSPYSTSTPTPTPTPSPPNFGPTSSPTPSPSIPEFPSWAIPLLLSILLVAAGLLVYFKKRKH
jgi:N-acetylneuraminic acid mutarotase